MEEVEVGQYYRDNNAPLNMLLIRRVDNNGVTYNYIHKYKTNTITKPTKQFNGFIIRQRISLVKAYNTPLWKVLNE